MVNYPTTPIRLLERKFFKYHKKEKTLMVNYPTTPDRLLERKKDCVKEKGLQENCDFR